MKWMLMFFLVLLIIQDIKYYTISLYNLIGFGLSALSLNQFSPWSALLGVFILLTLTLYIHLYLKKEIKNVMGIGDIFLLSIIFAITPVESIPYILFFSGLLGALFYYMFNKKYVPLGAGISASYGVFSFFI